MGKNAKVHKRLVSSCNVRQVSMLMPSATLQNKKAASRINSGTGGPSSSHTQVQVAKQKAGQKDKRNKSTRTREGGVLGGADYVSLMMGGRRKAKKEAQKLE